MAKRTEQQKQADREYDKKRKGKRTRNWAFLVYPQSAKEGWLDLLASMCIPAFVSPLHDKDTWTAYDEQENETHKQGEPKKAHYHVMFMFSSVKTYEQVMEHVSELGGTSCIPIEDAKAYARYLCHMGQKDKAQYDRDDVRQFGGADYAEMVEGTGDKLRAIAEMEDFIEEQGITSYAALSRYARANRRDWYRVLVWNGRHLKDVMKSAEWEKKQEQRAEQMADMLARGILKNERTRRAWAEHLAKKDAPAGAVPTAACEYDNHASGTQGGDTTTHPPVFRVPCSDEKGAVDPSDIEFAQVRKAIGDLWGVDLWEVEENGD